jgi:hypothetical protein
MLGHTIKPRFSRPNGLTGRGMCLAVLRCKPMQRHPFQRSLRNLSADARGEAAVTYLLVIMLAIGVTIAAHASVGPYYTAIARVHELVVNDVP